MTETAPEATETCRNGHPWTPENTRRRVSSGKAIRQCRTCAREAARRRSAAKGGLDDDRRLTPTDADAEVS